MSKLRCDCGEIISDSSEEEDNLYWGTILRNEEYHNQNERLSKVMTGFCLAFKEGRHIEWLAQNCPVFSEQDLPSIISDILIRESLDSGTSYARCPKCASILVRKNKNTDSYCQYSPVDQNVCEEI